MRINGIEFELTGNKYYMQGRGTVYGAILAENDKYTWDSVRKSLHGHNFKGNPIKGVEMFAIEWQSGKPIGILI